MDLGGILRDFDKVAELARVALPRHLRVVEELSAPHKRPRLPSGKSAVYIFLWAGQCLKVGRVGAKSRARYTYHPYNPRSSKSNLARSILDHKEEMGLQDLDEHTVGNWILQNTDRVNILLDESLSVCIPNLLEAFLHCRLKPRFEGPESCRYT